MSNTEERISGCDHCQRNTKQVRNLAPINWAGIILFTIITGGLCLLIILPAWAMGLRKKGSWVCMRCGEEPDSCELSAPVRRGFDVKMSPR